MIHGPFDASLGTIRYNKDCREDNTYICDEKNSTVSCGHAKYVSYMPQYPVENVQGELGGSQAARLLALICFGMIQYSKSQAGINKSNGPISLYATGYVNVAGLVYAVVGSAVEQ